MAAIIVFVSGLTPLFTRTPDPPAGHSLSLRRLARSYRGSQLPRAATPSIAIVGHTPSIPSAIHRVNIIAIYYKTGIFSVSCQAFVAAPAACTVTSGDGQCSDARLSEDLGGIPSA